MNENKIELFTLKGCDLIPDKCEAYRYMGLKRDYVSQELEKEYERCLSEYKEAAIYKSAIRKSSLSFEGEDTVVFDFCSMKSSSLRKNLEGCSSAYVFAATSGLGVDRLLLRFRRTSQLSAMVFDCIASSGIECFCDRVNSRISRAQSLKPRFSLGYGDTSLTYQRELLDFLDAQRLLGISLNASMMMTPIKSVTAFIGVKD